VQAIQRFIELTDRVLHGGRVGLLCNHTSYDFPSGQYLFQILESRGVLSRLFLPEHGLFAELQDQIPLSETSVYASLGLEARIVSLYGNTESTLVVEKADLEGLDALVIDLQDIGVRYYTFATTMRYVFEVMAREQLHFPVYILDRPNPAGPSIEGIALDASFESFVGPVGLPHRHGLTLGQLAHFFYQEAGASFPLNVIRYSDSSEIPFPIAPSPNMPGPYTQLVYSGQCLLEGTNLSEGRGTTRPFEIFGAPWMERLHKKRAPAAGGSVLRPLRFIPTFHKHERQICHGYQIHLTGELYHSLRHSLVLLRWIREECPEFAWRDGPYEFRSDRPAIELLAGHKTLIAYLNGSETESAMLAALAEGENSWRNRMRKIAG
jgi:uncharacterized protein YbbC (DUF1343 family)